MKKTFFILLVLTFIFISCDNEDMDEDVNPFVGTWEVDTGAIWNFTKNYIIFYRPNGDKSWSGSYIYNDTHITVHTDFRELVLENLELYPEPFVFIYKFQDNKLIIDNIATLTKQ